MFTDSNGCNLVGTSYAANHQRLTLSLLPCDGALEFQSAFVGLAAYRIDSHHLGKLITSVEEVAPTALILEDWGRVLAADQLGTWPGSQPTDPAAAATAASQAGLRGFRINFDCGESAWSICLDYVLLGRRQRA